MKDLPKAISVVAISVASLGGVWITKDPSALWALLIALFIVNNW